MKKLSLLTLSIITALSLSSCMMKSPEQIQAEKVAREQQEKQLIEDIQSNKNWEIIYNTNNFSAIETNNSTIAAGAEIIGNNRDILTLGVSLITMAGAKIATIGNDSPEERYTQFSNLIKEEQYENITEKLARKILDSFTKNGYLITETSSFSDTPPFLLPVKEFRDFKKLGEWNNKTWDKTKNRLRLSIYPFYYAESATSSYKMSVLTNVCIDFINSEKKKQTECFYGFIEDEKLETFYSFNSVKENRKKAFDLTKEFVEKKPLNLFNTRLHKFDFFKDIK